MSAVPRTLVIFVDGLGLGSDRPEVNPVLSGACPTLRSLLETYAVPVDAGLGVPGMPQSATGQATLFTGRNAAEYMGRHVEGCPGPTLRELVREENIFDKLTTRGYSSTFANAYYLEDLTEIQKRRRQSVSTVSALKAFGKVRLSRDLTENRAVYQDLTREVLIPRGYTGPIISPEDAAAHLEAIAREHHFTLFEYFQTDLMAHRGTPEEIRKVLSNLDRFLSALLPLWSGADRLLVLISDHGNVEDATTRSHTHNPVPLIALGPGSELLRREVRRLQDFTPTLLRLYPPAAEPAAEALPAGEGGG